MVSRPRQPVSALRRLGGVLLLALGLVLTACRATGRPGLPPGFVGVAAPEPLAPLFEKLDREGERNWVLNLDSLAIAALRHGERDIAKRALDEAILQIEVIYGNSAQARQARSLFYEEGSKIFKGDPHERSMTYFYRGVLYMQDADWENARACFRSAVLQDAFAEEDQ
ncbi:hypothetical protein HZA57_07560, partial [Candidatus Poribacteria bacterium]|nr:hypothetical protein [Candidatus Poribacteria bacterium]